MEERKISKNEQTIYERAEIGERTIAELRKLLKDLPVEVTGYLETLAVCCSGGTVAIVKYDRDWVKQK